MDLAIKVSSRMNYIHNGPIKNDRNKSKRCYCQENNEREPPPLQKRNIFFQAFLVFAPEACNQLSADMVACVRGALAIPFEASSEAPNLVRFFDPLQTRSIKEPCLIEQHFTHKLALSRSLD